MDQMQGQTLRQRWVYGTAKPFHALRHIRGHGEKNVIVTDVTTERENALS